jgi:hypothetical protein
MLAARREGHRNPGFQIEPGADPWTGLVAAIDRQNAAWVEVARRLSPPLLVDFLRLTGEQLVSFFRSLDPAAIGGPVDWAGPEPAPVWLDLAREYTERWTHQQHIRDAVGRPGLKERSWFHPVLATFAHGLQRALAGAAATPGTAVRLVVTGEAGGTWDAAHDGAGWRLVRAGDWSPAATVELDQETAWRLFTKGISPDEARPAATFSGDPALAERVLGTVSILAGPS